MKQKLLVTILPGFQNDAVIGNIKLNVGDEVKENDVVLSLEGKKGALEVKSSLTGKVTAILVKAGDIVKKDDALIEVEVLDEDKKCACSCEKEVKDVLATTMPGFQTSAVIGKIAKKAGDTVSKGEVLLALEGRKGNLEVKSELDGIVKEVVVKEGDTVEKDALLLKIEVSSSKEEKVETSNKKEVKYHGEVVVLGGGPGGYVAAIRASQRGKKTIIIEYDNLGGTCLNRGCIPTKSMVQSTRVLDTIKEASLFGMMDADCRIEMNKIIDRKQQVVGTLVGGLNSSMDRHGITVLRGKGKIHDEKSLEVDLPNEKAIVAFDDLILAPGSVVSLPPFEGADLEDNLTSDDLLELREIPKSLIILGGRVIAMEFAFIYAKLGCDVTVIQRSSQILPTMDDDIIETLVESAKNNGIKIYTNTKIHAIRKTADGGKLVEFEHEGETKYLSAEKLAVATGRKPNLEGLDLDKMGVEISPKYKGIAVDSHMKTNVPHVYAIGDATNIYNLAHVASKQGLVAVENIMGNPVEMKYNAVPEAVFTAPEIGNVGKTEKQCKKENIDYIVGKFPYMSNGKALVENATEGFVKVIARKEDRVIIGASLIGINAADLMCAFGNLVTIGATIDQAKDVIYAHPTVSETLSEAIEDLDLESIHK